MKDVEIFGMIFFLMTLSPEFFFNLTPFSHRILFENCTHVWEVFEKLSTYLSKKQLGTIEADISSQAYLIDRHLISIGKGTIVEEGAYIKGPCIIGENCTVRHGAYIRGFLLTGDECVIGHDTEVKNSIFLNNARAGHFAYIGDSILGNDVNLGAGTILANLRLDQQPISIPFEGKHFKTGLRKLGAILGDGVQTGCNSVCNPGTLMGKKALLYPLVNAGGVIKAGEVIR